MRSAERINFKSLCHRLHALAVFRGLLCQEVPAALLHLLDNLDESQPARTDAYGAFVAALYEKGGNLGSEFLRLVLQSENAAIRQKAAGQNLSAALSAALEEELSLFTQISQLVPEELAAKAAPGIHAPLFQNTAHPFSAIYTRRMAEIRSHGYGIFTESHMFTLGQSGRPCPVQNPDPQRLAELSGYSTERNQVIINTRALLKGLPAANILLYGDAGTGKSSTVKAIANEYKDRGLRLIEVRKDQIFMIPQLMGALAENPLKFILFIDDLSFPADDAGFTDLKAILEGNVSARPKNIVVYATSNRRHMLREQFSARAGSEVNAADTREEEASLAARFGLTVTFLRPAREAFLDIVRALATEYGLRTPIEEVLARAETYVLRQGGRSPRAARQFVEFVKASEEDTLDLPNF